MHGGGGDGSDALQCNSRTDYLFEPRRPSLRRRRNDDLEVYYTSFDLKSPLYSHEFILIGVGARQVYKRWIPSSFLQRGPAISLPMHFCSRKKDWGDTRGSCSYARMCILQNLIQ